MRVSHAHHRVRACVGNDRGTQMECTPRLEDSDAATVVLLRRNREPKSTADELASRVLVELPHGSGRQSRTLRVRVGDWFLEWPGCPVERIRVSAGQAPHVKLTTVTGRCEQRTGSCALIPRASSRRAEILANADARR
jgi:hypothetical protein